MSDRIERIRRITTLPATRQYALHHRRDAADYLEKVLREERDAHIRAVAGLGFEDALVYDLGPHVEAISRWWNRTVKNVPEARVVFSEPNQDNFRIFAYRLKKLGLAPPIWAARGDETIELVTRIRPHVLITNLKKTDLSGDAVILQLRELGPPFDRLPILWSSVAEAPRHITGELDGILSKPIVEPALLGVTLLGAIVGRLRDEDLE